MELHNLKPAEGSRKGKKRVGRGEASGLGKTAGRGAKGQRSRSGGNAHPYFEGGQMPFYRRIPKIGFRSRKKTRGENCYLILNLSDLERFTEGTTIDKETLKAVGIKTAHDERAGIKILGSGKLSKKLSVKVNAISESAKQKIESLGGTVEIIA